MESLEDSSVIESQTSYYLELRSTPRKMFGYLEHIFRRKETEVENADPKVSLPWLEFRQHHFLTGCSWENYLTFLCASVFLFMKTNDANST